MKVKQTFEDYFIKQKSKQTEENNIVKQTVYDSYVFEAYFLIKVENDLSVDKFRTKN